MLFDKHPTFPGSPGRLAGLGAGLCAAAAALLLHAHGADAGPLPARVTPHGAPLSALAAASRNTCGPLTGTGGAPAARVCNPSGDTRACEPMARRECGPGLSRKPTPAEPRRIEYMVRSGDSWPEVALRHGVAEEQLRAWNPDIDLLNIRMRLTIEVPRDFEPIPIVGLEIDRDPSGLPLVPVAQNGESRGHPSGGRLLNGVPLPRNPALYWIRRPEFAYGSTHTVENLQLAMAKFRAQSSYPGPIIISDMSRKRGGRFAHHNSHTNGRDVDIWLPLRAELIEEKMGVPAADVENDGLNYWELGVRRPRDIDWKATLTLIKALVRTAQVRYIFLSRSRQRFLYRAAKAENMPDEVLAALIEFPKRDKGAIVRHAPRHGAHMHVRFRCSRGETRCY